MRHSKPLMLNSRLGLSLEYTDTKVLSQPMVVTERGSRFLMSQKTARPLYKYYKLLEKTIITENVIGKPTD